MRDRDGGDADRDVDQEDPPPRQAGRQRPADDRTDRDRQAGDRAPDAERGAALAALERAAEQRQRGGEHRRAADPLRAAGQVEQQRVGGQPRGQRAQR